jgi:hypothetical protein
MLDSRYVHPAQALSAVVAALLAASLCSACASQDVELEHGRLTVELPQNDTKSDEAWARHEEDFNRSIELLRVELQEPSIVAAVRQANADHEALTLDEIYDLDAGWQDASTGASHAEPEAAKRGAHLRTEITGAPCSQDLRRFQATFTEFVEIFVTDEKGLNVCQTNPTTDYYQADEPWWLDAWHSGHASHGPLEFDKSASTYAVSIYVPMTDPDTHATIGLAKGVLRKNASLAD